MRHEEGCFRAEDPDEECSCIGIYDEVAALRAELAETKAELAHRYECSTIDVNEILALRKLVPELRADVEHERKSRFAEVAGLSMAVERLETERDSLKAALAKAEERVKDLEAELFGATYRAEVMTDERDAECARAERLEEREKKGVALFDGLLAEERARVAKLQSMLAVSLGDQSEERFRADDAENELSELRARCARIREEAIEAAIGRIQGAFHAVQDDEPRLATWQRCIDYLRALKSDRAAGETEDE